MRTAPEWDAAQVRRLARHLGYVLVWPPDITLLPYAQAVLDNGRASLWATAAASLVGRSSDLMRRCPLAD